MILRIIPEKVSGAALLNHSPTKTLLPIVERRKLAGRDPGVGGVAKLHIDPSLPEDTEHASRRSPWRILTVRSDRFGGSAIQCGVAIRKRRWA